MPSRTYKFRGSRTHGRGRKAGRGKGMRGGTGNAGLHKHKWIWTVIYDPYHFGRYGFVHHSGVPPGPRAVSLRQVESMAPRLLKEGRAVMKDGRISLDLTAMGFGKLLGGGRAGRAYRLVVGAATAKAVEEVKAAGGEVATSSEGGT